MATSEFKQMDLGVELRSDAIDLYVISFSPQFVTIQVFPRDDKSWLFSVVYGSPNEQLRDELWEKLSDFNQHNDRPWLLAGDFNDTKLLEEGLRCDEGLARRCFKFIRWIENNGLFDLGFLGPRYTWYRGRGLKGMPGLTEGCATYPSGNDLKKWGFITSFNTNQTTIRY
ncbi:LOW QUALITY PROTEIN: hypothetical protein Cgig2_024064 [Carnegiea gigantea]|uniref:Endonuclease/exonuclease/phosphatase domain-containing protein n=1 Tax=Carnegiea gigantea TaxID=171969 RepID=A0A9Q1JZJ3_9CARY|nr:LOW QUALITY PROTEIN: hypothetical protein Cgig2_024064 [Carnegiea gigantea]